MGTPDLTVKESISLYAEIGLDGIELVCQEGTPFSKALPRREIDDILRNAKDKRLEIVTLTPYMWDINSLDQEMARNQIQGLMDYVDLARDMGARFVRAYGGREVEVRDEERGWANTVLALKEVGEFAGSHGITLVVENHPGTMTRSGRETSRMIEAVGLESVKALFDPANVLYHTDEPWEETLNVQKGHIAHVHAKDYYLRGGERIACNVGDGMVAWDKILLALRETGYDGYISLEYEKKWHPDQLTDAEDGMAKSAQFIRKVLEI